MRNQDFKICIYFTIFIMKTNKCSGRTLFLLKNFIHLRFRILYIFFINRHLKVKLISKHYKSSSVINFGNFTGYTCNVTGYSENYTVCMYIYIWFIYMYLQLSCCYRKVQFPFWKKTL